MYLDNMDGTKFKCVCTDFPNIVVTTNSATPGEIQVTFWHMSIGNKSLGKTITAFSLAGSSEYLMVVYINNKRAFTRSRDKIRLPIMDVLLCASISEL